MSKLFPTYEIGSIAKPRWRVKGYAGRKLNQADLDDAEKWAKILGIDYSEVETVLKGDSPNRKQEIVDLSALYVLTMFEKAGLDYVYDGEQWRVEMYEHVIRNLGGFKFSGWIKSFDYRYFKKASVVEKVSYKQPYYLEEYESVYGFFEAVAEDNKVIDDIKLPKKEAKTLLEHIKGSIKPQRVEVTGYLKLTTHAPDGIKVIKDTLEEARQHIPKSLDLTITYISAPHYRIQIEAPNYKKAEKSMKSMSEQAIKFIKAREGEAEFLRELPKK